MIRLGAPDRFCPHVLLALGAGKCEGVVLLTLGIPLVGELDDRPAAPMDAARRGCHRRRGRDQRRGRRRTGNRKGRGGMVLAEWEGG